MKAKIIILSTAIIISLFSVSVSVFALPKQNNSSLNSLKSQNKEYYLLKAYNNILAIYHSSDLSNPIETINTYIYSLPEKDRDKIIEGITANSLSEIMLIVEDYE